MKFAASLPSPLKWMLGAIALVLALGAGAYGVFYLYLLFAVLGNVFASFWPLMAGTMAAGTALGGYHGYRSGQGAKGSVRSTLLGLAYSTCVVALIVLCVGVVAVFTFN